MSMSTTTDIKDTAGTPAHAHGLGDESSIWFKLTPLLKGPDNPLTVLIEMTRRYGSPLRLNLANQNIVLLAEPDQFKHVLVSNAANYEKYFDGLKPIFGNSMITNDGARWQKIRMPQQPAFHPDMFVDYVPYFVQAINQKMANWKEIAVSGEEFEMVEQTWTLAADMICKALFDRDMLFDPHFVFKCVKTYTDVMNHKSIRLRKVAGEDFDLTEENAAKAIEAWHEVPDLVMASDPREHREKTLLKIIEAAVADPAIPEFDHQQAVDELKQYLWAGTETTALTLAWAMYLTSIHPEAASRIREEGEAVLGDREPTAADYSALAYTRAVIQETMRIYPPVWSLIRVAAAADEIGDKKVEPGDRVVMFAYGVHHDARFWEAPEEFRPERWMGDAAKKRQKYTYLPFGAGRRSCIGGAMSQVENTLALSILLRRFRLEYTGANPPGISGTVTLTPRGGLMFKVHERA